MLRKSRGKETQDKKESSQDSGRSQEAAVPDTPKQERPRICLIDVSNELSLALNRCGLNCYSGTLGPVVDVPNTSQHSSCQCLPNFDFPPNLHEYEIIIVDLQTPRNTTYNPEQHTRTKTKGPEQFYFLSSFPETIFDPRPLSASVLESRLRPLMDKDSIIIVFTAPQEDVFYQPVAISVDGNRRHDRSRYSLYDFYTDLPNWENITGKDTAVVAPEGTTITALLSKHNADTVYTISFDHPTRWENSERVKSKSFIPLMTAGPDKIVSFAQVREKNWAFFFPKIADKEAFLCDLLEKVLPGITPPVFPYSTEFAWLADSRYRLPNEEKLHAERDRVKTDFQSKLDAIDLRIDANRQEHGYLHDLLKESGAGLVKTVERFFRWLDFDDVVNADETNPDLQEEDLRVETSSGLLVVEVKGIGGTSTDSECSQISKIKYRRAKERESFDVFGLYCVNHQRYLPPDNRQNPPFNSRQIQDAQNDERGLVTTYDLFKLYFNITRGFVSKDDAGKAMLQFGLVTFPPSEAQEILPPFELHHNGLVVVFELQQGLKLQQGHQIVLDDAGWYSSTTITEIQVDGKNVETVTSGEVGIKLSAPVSKSSRLWLRETTQEKKHPTTASTATNEPAADGSI